MAEPASAFLTFFGGEQLSIFSARSVCQFNMVAAIKTKHKHYYGTKFLFALIPDFPVLV